MPINKRYYINEKKRSLEPFSICLLSSTANPAHFGWIGCPIFWSFYGPEKTPISNVFFCFHDKNWIANTTIKYIVIYLIVVLSMMNVALRRNNFLLISYFFMVFCSRIALPNCGKNLFWWSKKYFANSRLT